jgi:hypothetical protein
MGNPCVSRPLVAAQILRSAGAMIVDDFLAALGHSERPPAPGLANSRPQSGVFGVLGRIFRGGGREGVRMGQKMCGLFVTE